MGIISIYMPYFTRKLYWNSNKILRFIKRYNENGELRETKITFILQKRNKPRNSSQILVKMAKIRYNKTMLKIRKRKMEEYINDR